MKNPKRDTNSEMFLIKMSFEGEGLVPHDTAVIGSRIVVCLFVIYLTTLFSVTQII
jgi:putative exporter of polyketide antibiotics